MTERYLNYCKVMNIVEQLQKILPEIQAYNRERSQMVLGDTTDYSRVVLANPTTQEAVFKAYKMNDGRIRFAFPTVFEGHQQCYLELYNVAGAMIGEPINAVTLPAAAGLAVQLELFSVLLISKGIDINDY